MSHSEEGMRSPGARGYWPLLVAGPLLLAHIFYFNFVTDDAYITFVYSRNLARHGELVFNLGERVEGYTNFLWAVILGALLKVGIEPALSSRLLGGGFALGTLAVVVRMARRMGGDSPWNAVAPLLLAGCGAFACWSSGGLETAMFAFFVTLGVAFYLEDRPVSAACLAFAALTRPEGNLLFALMVVHRLLFRRDSRLGLRWLLLYALLYVPYFAWRYHYYGYPFPNTFYVKSSGGAGTVRRGLFYLGRFLLDYGVWFLVPLLLPPDSKRRGAWRLMAVLSVGLLAYIVKVGGDFMGLYRFLVPILPLWALLAQASFERLAKRRAGKLALALLGLAFFGLSARTSHRARTLERDDPKGSGIDTPGFLKRFADDRALIGRWMGQYTRADDLMTVGGAGSQVYYADVRAIDAFGLNDAFIAHQVPASSNRPGHQKWAPDSYLLSRHPTILCHRYSISRTPYVPPAGDAMAWRQKGFRWVSARIPGLDPPYYNFLLRSDRSFGPFAADLRP